MYTKLGYRASVFDLTDFGSSCSVRNFCRLGSVLSVFAQARYGSSISVLDFLHLGSSLSLRSFVRAGSSTSVIGVSRFGAATSVLDFLHLGSSLSLRAIARLGSALSVNGVLQVQQTCFTARSPLPQRSIPESNLILGGVKGRFLKATDYGWCFVYQRNMSIA